jgi:hypothetical protein
MVQLTIYKESNNSLWDKNHKEIIQAEVETIEKAILLGQNSGAYYEVFDTKTCRLIDWNEVNIKEEDPWYYDEAEMMWKKHAEEEFSAEFMNHYPDIFLNPYQDHQLLQPSC